MEFRSSGSSGTQSLIRAPIAWSHVTALVGGGMLLMILLVLALPVRLNYDDTWVDHLRAFVLHEKTLEQAAAVHPDDKPAGTFEPYLGQLELVRNLFRSGNQHRTYVAMNRFMDMLEAREGGISNDVAEAIWDYCYRVTPARYHDVSRHLRADRKILDKLESYSSSPME